MDNVLTYIDQVEELIQKKRENLDQKGLNQIREGFQAYQTLFENIYNILLRKGIIQEDPYKYDEKISEVSAPDDEAFLDTEKQNKMSQRLAHYHTQLEFLNNYYQFSLEFLTLGRLKRIVKLLKYCNRVGRIPSSSSIKGRRSFDSTSVRWMISSITRRISSNRALKVSAGRRLFMVSITFSPVKRSAMVPLSSETI